MAQGEYLSEFEAIRTIAGELVWLGRDSAQVGPTVPSRRRYDPGGTTDAIAETTS